MRRSAKGAKGRRLRPDARVDGRRSAGADVGGKRALLFGVVMLVVGLGLLLYPLALDILAQAEISDALTELYAQEDGASADDNSSHDDSTTSNIGNATDAEKAASETYQQFVEYNELVRTGQAGAINDPFGFSDADLEAWGLSDGIIGQIDIPAMGVSLPLYLGATSENMSQGAAVVAGTSVPLGEEDSNCVIAAHRGLWAGLSMFRDIEKLEIGDLVTITTLWDTLVYAVTGTEVVTPDAVDAVGVQEGRDMITLLTCHPYGYSTYRMLVFCERVDAEPQTSTAAQNLITQLTPDLSGSSVLLVLEGLLRLAGLGILAVLGIALVLQAVSGWRRRRKEDGPSGGAPPRHAGGAGVRPQGRHGRKRRT